ncbi:ATPase, T2SS/T4P/T4SS family [Plantactinospora mayteni]|uniref:Protein kinase n=1 Tax=Plantactinospora mayteni TaxID=566021 RepID=A0ABQ4EIP7_9ACTN|nr:ATPase, T2SS/T4P/T4SS family [Plantactinospora mayteni]GIG94613.1 protein kinase [Plantactinospora mayteni]
MATEAELVVELRGLVAGQMAAHAGTGPMPIAERRRLAERYTADVLDAHAQQAVARGDAPLSAQAEARVSRAIVDRIAGAGGLESLLGDKDVENIEANGCNNVFVHRTDGSYERVSPIAESDDELVELIRAFASEAAIGDDEKGTGQERTFDRNNPVLDLRLRDGSRLCAVMSVSARPSLSIRRATMIEANLNDLVGRGMLSAGMAEVIQAAMRAHLNTIFAGGTNTGKTTFARAAARAIPVTERLITIEDAYELELYDPDVHPNVLAFQSRRANLEGVGAVSMSALVRTALRMRPDRVVVGEARGDEVIDLLKAMSQGNDGSFATVHASSSGQAFTRLMMYAVQAPERLTFEASAMLIAESVHLVVHLDWTPDRKRVVSSVREVVGFDGRDVASNEVWRPGPDRRAVPNTPLRAETLDRLEAAGLRAATIERIGW